MKELFSPWHSGRTLSSQALRIQRSRWLVAVVLCCFIESIAFLFHSKRKKNWDKIWNRKPGFKAIKYVHSLLLVTHWPYQDRHFVCHSFNFYVWDWVGVSITGIHAVLTLFSSLFHRSSGISSYSNIKIYECVSINCACTCIWCHLDVVIMS